MRGRFVAIWSIWLGGWPALVAAQQAPGPAPSAPASFWDRPMSTALGYVMAFFLGMLLVGPLKSLLRQIILQAQRVQQRLLWIQAYLRALGEEHQWLKLIGVSSRVDLHPPRLQEVYVSLRLAASRAEEATRLGWEQILSREEGGRRVVFLGSPGAGKSTLLDYLVLVFTGVIRHPLRAGLGKPLPLFGRLRQLGAEESLPTLLARSGPVALPVDLVERKLRGGGCLVLLDGLDEVIDEDQQERALEEAGRWAAAASGNWFVLTCRMAGWQSNWLPGFRVFEVQAFDRDDIRRFLGAWYREVLRTEKANALGVELRPEQLQAAETKAFTEARERSEELWAALQANEGLLRLAGTPLMLSLMTLVHYHQTDLPQERGKLYGQCLEILLELWDKQDKKLKLPDGPSPREKRLVLQEVAFHFLKEGLVDAGLPELETVLAPVRKDFQKEIPLDRLVRQIWERSGVLVEQAPGRYGFAHRALHDFLAAEHIAAHGLDDLVLAHVGEDRWREVILIAVGLVNRARAERLVRALVGQQDGESGAALEVAGLFLAEDVQLGADLRAEVKQRLLERLDREEQAGAFARLAAALRVADLEAARRWIDEQLRQGDQGRQWRVLELVNGLGEEQGIPLAPLLVRLLGDVGAAELVRVRAAMTLSRWPGMAADGAVWEVLRQAQKVNSAALRNATSWAWCELGRAGELGLVKVPAGEFLMGSPEREGRPDEHPQHYLYLPTFYIGRDPVTVACFRDYLDESGRRVKSHLPAGWDDHPVANVTWYEALECAEWHGWMIPSEAEWEKAARGTDGRRWPWGNEWTSDRANAALKSKNFRGTTTPVGKFSPAGDSPYGCRDMAGNVKEWTRSLWGEERGSPNFASFHYPYVAGDGRENLKAPAQQLSVLRGGSFSDASSSVRCAFRHRNVRSYFNDGIGFRFALLPIFSAP